MVKFDPVLNKLRQKDGILQYDSDPSTPKAQDAWVTKTTSGQGGGVGSPYGLLLSLTMTGTEGVTSYEFRYRTKEGTTVGASLS